MLREVKFKNIQPTKMSLIAMKDTICVTKRYYVLLQIHVYSFASRLTILYLY